MKKVFKCTLVVIFVISFFSFYSDAAVFKKKLSSKQKIEFSTIDGHILVGDLYLAQHKSDKPLVVCMHSFAMNAYVWEELANQLRLKDYNVLAMDLRGHGRSVYNDKLKIQSRYQFQKEDWQKLPKDYAQSIKYIQSNYAYVNTDDVIIVGADLGATSALIGSLSIKNAPLKMVLISPVLSFKGLNMPIKSHKFFNSKMMYITSKNDRVILNFYLNTPPIVKQYPLGGPGTQLIKANNEAVFDIVNFIIN